MTRKVGTYYFARHRSMWGIWLVESVMNGVVSGIFVKNVPTFENAVKETYHLNGWGEPKRVYKKF